MKERLHGLIAGIAIGAICTTGVALAKTAVETIEVSYDDIKVYKDNVLCELKDANGSVIEPFIYNGTTYMPVRGTANLADMQVTWDGNTKSVYLWDEMVPEGTVFLEECPPYEKNCDSYLSTNGESFEMAGEKYSNGLGVVSGSYALFNLNGKFSTIECTVGHKNDNQESKSVTFIVDGKAVQEIYLEPEDLPKKVSIPINYGLQLKIVGGTGYYGTAGIGNMIVK